jgi:hypothetical protein
VGLLNRLTQSFHREFDIGRLQRAPALYLSLIPILRVALEIYVGQLVGGRMYAAELLSWVSVQAGFFVCVERG